MNILGISCYYHESAACLIQDGKIIAASAEERFSRIKHDFSFPKQAIQFCLEEGGITHSELDYVVFYEKPFIKLERNLSIIGNGFPHTLSLFIDSMRNTLSEKLWIKATISSYLKISSEKILFVPHHLSHAAAAFFTSPFDDAAFLTLDGVGEWTTGSWGVGDGATITPHQHMRFPHSVGLLYAAFTSYLGFMVNDGEYKVMGMAAYGKPKYKKLIQAMYQQNSDGSIALDMSYFLFDRKTSKMYSKKFEKILEGKDTFDIAASIQACVEETIMMMLSYVKKQTKKQHIVLGGGVFLNSLVNAKLTRKKIFKDVFIFPAAGDDGGAVGAALYAYHHVLKKPNRNSIQDVFLGPSYSKQYIRNFLESKRILYTYMSPEKLSAYVAKHLTKGEVIGWFEGKAEFGPRALGHRSILADPRKKEMKDIVNARIKFREKFRPFAPAILAERTKGYFTDVNAHLAMYMLGAFVSTQKAKQEAPAVIHEDNTSRVQIVPKDFPGVYRKVIEKFFALTGVPMVLNTSLNIQGEPIVQTPEDAYATFMKSGLDMLVMEGFVLTRK